MSAAQPPPTTTATTADGVTVDESEVAAPFVVQCAECARILTDSFSFVSADEELQTVSFENGQVAVDTGDVVYEKEHRTLMGSAYHLLQCIGCGSINGRKYISTPRLYDSIRDMYTFDLDKVTSYMLGTAVNEDMPPTQTTLSFIPSAQNIQSLRQEIAKVQQMFLLVNERLLALENSAATIKTNSADSKGKPRGKSKSKHAYESGSGSEDEGEGERRSRKKGAKRKRRT